MEFTNFGSLTGFPFWGWMLLEWLVIRENMVQSELGKVPWLRAEVDELPETRSHSPILPSSSWKFVLLFEGFWILIFSFVFVLFFVVVFFENPRTHWALHQEGHPRPPCHRSA